MLKTEKSIIVVINVRGQRFSIPKAYLEKANVDFRYGRGSAKSPEELAVAEFLSFNPKEREKTSLWKDFFYRVHEC